MPIDYETLRLLWWLLLGVLLMGFAIMDGFDLGVAMWLPWLAKSDSERRILINSIAPTWEGNQVWFILGGGAIFAAWPMLYALAFSGFYIAMLLILLALILRPVGFKYRSKLASPVWRQSWDWALFIGGFLPSVLFGAAIGNVIQGVPFHFDHQLRAFYTGSFVDLLNPFGLLCGLVSVTMLAMHGAFFLNTKTTESIQKKAMKAGRIAALLTIILFIAAGIWLYFSIDGYRITSMVPPDGPSNPLYKTAIRLKAAWFSNYQQYPFTMLAPMAGILGAFMAILMAKQVRTAFIFSACSIGGIIATVGVSMFPFILPSSSHPDQSLTVWDSSSSSFTLFLMLVATLFFLPIILGYTAWVYRVLRGKITEEHLQNNQDSAY